MDGNIFLGKATIKEASKIKEALGCFELATNQKVKLNKSNVYFINTPGITQRRVSGILEMGIKKLPTSYLGMPLFVGKMSKDMWNPLIDQMKRKLAG